MIPPPFSSRHLFLDLPSANQSVVLCTMKQVAGLNPSLADSSAAKRILRNTNVRGGQKKVAG